MPRRARLSIFVFCLFSFAVIGQERQFIFDKVKALSVQPGSTAPDLDEHGRLWFGTPGRGLFCYDGYEHYRWQYDAEDSLSLGSDRIFCIEADSRQRVWVGTINSLNCLDRRTGMNRRWASIGDSVFQFRSLFEDRKGQIWVTGDPKSPETYRYEETGDRFLRVPPMAGKKPVLLTQFVEDTAGQIWAASGESIFEVHETGYSPRPFSWKKSAIPGKISSLWPHSDGKIWFAAEKGLFRFNPQNNLAERVALPDSLDRMPIADLLFAEDGQFWFALGFSGLACWNPLTGVWRHFRHRLEQPDHLFLNVAFLQTDHFGNLWFCGRHPDIGRLNLRPSPISLWQAWPAGQQQRINSVFRLAEDRLGRVLVCTAMETSLIEKWGQAARHISIDPADPTARIPFDFFREKNGTLWTISRTLLEWNVDKMQFSRRFEKELAGFGGILNLEQDFENEAVFWIGTTKGLLRFDRSTGQIEHFKKVNESKFLPNVNGLCDDGQGHLWLIVEVGLCRFDKKTGEIRLFNSTSPAPQQLANNEIFEIERAPDGFIWVVTIGGINRINPATNEWQLFNRNHGLPDHLTNSVLFDPDGNAWVSCPEYFARREAKTGNWQVFDKISLLRAGSWTRGKVALADGRLLFSSVFGIIELRPNELQLLDNQEVKSILLTNFEVGNQPFGGRQGSFEFLKNVQLAAGQNDLVFEWAGIQTTRSKSLHYQYRLVGLHEKWIDCGTERRAVFSNLAPGDYHFRVRVAGEKAELDFRFVIAPPWFQTAWFRMLVGLLVLVAAVVFFNNRKAQRLLRQQKELAEQNSRYKTRFLANVSHEIRTPMNAIVGLSRLLTEADLPAKPKDYAEAIRQSSENLLVLINDVLDQAKIESGKFSFQHRPFNLALIITHLQNTLGLRAVEKGLQFEVVFEDNLPMNVVGDPVRLTQILTNLVGNSIKFTERGEVKLGIGNLGLGTGEFSTQSPIYQFTISDTGIGIDEERLDRIFESFQQADDDIAATYGGTGLGLSITKQLVEQQGGKIWLESEAGRGTTFFVELPFEAAKSAQVIENQSAAATFEFPKLKILLVEDTFFNQMLARELLESRLPDVEIEVAENGQIALEKLTQNGSGIGNRGLGIGDSESLIPDSRYPIPGPQSPFDLILMDVKMPVMDGLEATRRIRRLPDSRICRLPIIGLTANAVAEELEKCRAAGMNAWVTKPIDSEEFFATMARVLNARQPIH